MATDPKDLIDVIYLIQKGAATAIIPKEEITHWADSFIERDDEPDIFFIELSMCHTLNDVYSYISDFFFHNSINTADIVISPRPLFGYCYRHLPKSKLIEWEVTNFLRQFTWDRHFRVTEIEEAHIYSLDDPYYGFRDGKMIGATQEFTLEYVFKFLDNYNDYCLANYKEWPELDKKVDSRLVEFDEKMDIAIQEFIDKNTIKPTAVMKSKPWWKFW